MKSLAGSKRTAGTPAASPTKAAASTKRSRTQYDYYDEEDSSMAPEDQRSADTDPGSEMSLDSEDEPDCTGDWSVVVPPRSHRSHQDSRDAEQPAHLPPAASPPTRRVVPTAKARVCTGWFCSKYGRRCNASACGCPGGASCRNPFRTLDLVALFGQDTVALHPCFITWVGKQSTARLERMTAQSLFSLVFRKASVLAELNEEVTGPYLEWRARWDRLPAARHNGPAGLALKQELLSWGLTSQGLPSTYYSFCRKDGWVETDHEWHCAACGECRQWREWHCMNCKQCSYGLALPCANCRRTGDWSPDSELGGPDLDDMLESWCAGLA